ncbi:MAG TPA: alpha/beta hydrolase fold domain-containing protein [Ideonella sp.]|uniref:alpha/beta hydrolase fold domain-containing protein n=1 Tax=Ideonella sp. TaxID=1929293 RepID=UPI002BA2F705|nr:alpha/beta hydrolase fold domain-containing protein [Ideonella sp.]HSI47849.1 alpha/beta hydrolase fold domain-containing protein [Ideonella sp.]
MPSLSPLITAAWRDTRVDAGLEQPLSVRIHRAAEPGLLTVDGQPLARPLVLHLPGGAFIGGDLDSGLATARLLAQSGCVVVSLDYPHAPEQPFPAALQAAAALLRWMQRARTRLAGAGAALLVAGEEAGANLAAGLALWARDQGKPLAGQLLLSPLLDPCLATASLRAAGQGDASCPWARGWRAYLGDSGGDHPYAAPLHAARLGGVAPAMLVTATDDPLRDEAHRYSVALQRAGVAARLFKLAGPTGWPMALSKLASLQAPWAAALRPALREFLIDCLSRCPAARRSSRRASSDLSTGACTSALAPRLA